MENTTEKYRYDAFISYRHLPGDMAAAQTLQKLLEKHKITVIQNGKKIQRKLHIFRDQTELPTSGNLGEDIREALRESRYLIILCSPQLMESRWCMEEIAYFKHLCNDSNSRILPLLTDGEPEESFPEAIRWDTRRVPGQDGTMSYIRIETEPLGADIRAATRRKQLHRLKTEYYRIAAPILGCRFDDLYRRAQRAKRRQIIAASVVILCCALIFSIYNLYMLRQITDRQQRLYTNESLRLASDSQDATESGDYFLSMLLAQEALPKNQENPERPVVPEAEAALRSAVTQELIDYAKLPCVSRAVVPFNVASWWICGSYDEGNKVSLTDFDKTYLYDSYNGRLIFSCETEEVYFNKSARRASRQQTLEESDTQKLILDLYCTDSNEHYFSGTYEVKKEENTFINLFAIWDEDTDDCWVVKQIRPYSQQPGIPTEAETILLDRIDAQGIRHTQEALPDKILHISEDYQYSYLSDDSYITPAYDYSPDENGLAGNTEIDRLIKQLSAIGYSSVRGIREMKGGELLTFYCDMTGSGGFIYNGMPEYTVCALWSRKENRWLTILPGTIYEEPQSGLLYQHTSTEFRTLSLLDHNFGTDLFSTDYYLMVSTSGERYADVEEDGDFLYFTLWDSANLNEPDLRIPIKEYTSYYVTPDLAFVFLQTPENSLQFWSADGKLCLELDPVVSSDICCLTVDRNHKRLAVGYRISDSENQIRIYDAADGKELQSFQLNDMGNYGLSHLEFEGNMFLAASRSRSAVLDLTGEKETVYFNDPNYGSRRDSALTSDGLLFCTSETNVGNSLEAIYDLKTGRQLMGYTSVFQYNESSGTLAYINYNSQATMSGTIYVTHRKEDGTFDEPMEISSLNANMSFDNSGQNLDDQFLLLNSEECCEIYSTQTGAKLVELNSGGFGLVNGVICDLQKNGSQKALQFPIFSLEELYHSSEKSLTSFSVTRVLNEREKASYFITADDTT